MHISDRWFLTELFHNAACKKALLYILMPVWSTLFKFQTQERSTCKWRCRNAYLSKREVLERRSRAFRLTLTTGRAVRRPTCLFSILSHNKIYWSIFYVLNWFQTINPDRHVVCRNTMYVILQHWRQQMLRHSHGTYFRFGTKHRSNNHVLILWSSSTIIFY